MDMKKLTQVSLLNTIRFNLRYFRGGGIALVAKNVKFVNLKGSIEVKNPKTGIISIGFGVSSKKTIWDNEGTIVFNGKAHLAAGDKISNKGNLTFGDNFAMHIDSTVICYEKISFGDDCLISWECQVMDTDFHKIYQNGEQINLNRPVQIGKHVWIGSRSAILKGSEIANDCIVAAGSTMAGKITEERQIVASGKTLKTDVDWCY